MSKARQLFLVLVAGFLLLPAVGCASESPHSAAAVDATPAPAHELLYLTHLVLRPQHPAHLTFQVAAGALQVTANTSAPLVSWRLQQVSPPSGGSRPLGSGDAALRRLASGPHDCVLRTTQPLAAGWYRLELVGRGEIVQLSVRGH
jgi:hypothetical protein